MDNNYFKILIGEQLSSVEFVQDYLQLHFDGNTLTFYVWPTVFMDKEYSIDDDSYRNKLCSLIANKVSRINFIDNQIFAVEFERGDKIVLQIERSESNKDIPEFLYFSDINKEWLVID